MFTVKNSGLVILCNDPLWNPVTCIVDCLQCLPFPACIQGSVVIWNMCAASCKCSELLLDNNKKCQHVRKKERKKNTLSPSDSVYIPSLFVISWQQLTGVNAWADVTAGSGWCPVAGHHVPKHMMTQTITITIPHVAHGHCLLKKVKNNSKYYWVPNCSVAQSL